ncbi:MAG: ribonucleoside-diphosphate reductase subunit alpha [Gammaproteobacteria bacterium]
MTNQIISENQHKNPGANAPSNYPSSNIEFTQPGQLRVIRRNGQVTPYNDSKINVAITKAFLAVEGSAAAASTRIHETVAELTQQITHAFQRRMPSGGTIHIEDIQDQVELALMRTGQHKVAREYVLYREARRKARAEKQVGHPTQIPGSHSGLHVTLDDGAKVPLDEQRLHTIVSEACQDLADVEPDSIIHDALQNLFDGAPVSDVSKALIMVARTLIEQEPNYGFVAARLLLDTLRTEALSFLGVANSATMTDMTNLYPIALEKYIQQGVELELLDAKLLQYDLKKLGQALKAQRDLQFTYLGLQTLYDRYFIHSNGTRFELPQVFFMRVAMGLALNEQDKETWAIKFYNLLSSFDYMSSTPTLFNSGTLRPQLSSCYLTTVPDDLSGIYSAIRDNALLSKFAGGLGNDWTPVRAMGARIKGTNGKSQGVVPFLNVADATAIAVNQGGKRKGAVCAYLETWHLDIEDFLDLRKNTGDDRRRTHDMNTANWIPDLFMKRVFENGEWTLFSPDEVPDLHDLYGEAFEKAYIAYEKRTQIQIAGINKQPIEEDHDGDDGDAGSNSGSHSQGLAPIRNFKRVSAVKLWRKMLSMLFETGHPWITFKDACNLRSPQQHAGVIHSSNLCTEITLNTSNDEIAVCNLGSINLPQHIQDGKLDTTKLQHTINIAIRMLDNVIDYNYYSVPQARRSNLKHRPIGLGLMGFQDALYKLGIDYASNPAIEFADRSMEIISYYAISASVDLAEERGSYESFEGSLWSQGILPIDSINLLQQARGQYLEQDHSQTLDWDKLRTRVQTTGMRNSNVMAIAPTATISNICGVSASIEPTYQNLFVKSNLSGEFTVVNPYLVQELKKLNLWDKVMVNDLKYFDGSLQKINRIPDDIKRRFATAFEIEPKWLVEAGSRRQKWIDQAQSLNLYIAQASGKKLDTLYRMAWLRGLKTTYYCRTLGATSTEKTSISDGALNAVKIDTLPKACAIDDPDCEACQ